MKRTELIGRLLKEGFSEKTLVNFTDKQLNDLSERIVTTAKDMAANPEIQKLANDPNKTVEVKETLKGKQKNIDKNHNGKIDSDDFAILNKEKKGETKEDVNEADMGLTIKGSKSSSSSVFSGVPKKSSSPKKKSTPKKKEEGETEEGEVDESLNGLMLGVIKDKLTKDLGREPKDHEMDKAHEDFINNWKKDNEYKERMKKNPYNPGKPPSPDFNGYNKRKKKKEEEKSKQGDKTKDQPKKKEEVDELLRFYDDDGNPIKNKKGEQDAVSTKHKDFEKKTKSKKCPDCGEHMKDCKCDHSHLDENRKIKNWVNNLVENEKYHSFTSKNEIMELIQSKINESETMMASVGPRVKKGHNGVPEFMTYEAIKSGGPAVAPTKPKPGTKPGTNPGTKPKTPYRPGIKPSPKPKASFE